jgi:hypothetical protein
VELATFRSSPALPAALSPALRALWLDLQNDWDAAHHLVQDDASRESAWVHAYLHRKEGDLPNAGYWYRQAGHSRYQGSLQAEWESIARTLLESATHLE